MIEAEIDKLVNVAQSQVGYTEKPKNLTKFGKWYGMDGVAWCAIFQSWVFAEAGSPLPAMGSKKGFSWCPDVVTYAKNNKIWKPRSQGGKRGDIIVFSFGGVRADHVGLVKGRLSDGRYHTIEGNTNSAGSRTGGSVLERYRASQIIGFVDVKQKAPVIDYAALRRTLAGHLRTQFGAAPNMNGSTVNCCNVALLQEVLNLVSNAKLTVDGVYGVKTVQAVLNFQHFMRGLGIPIADFPGACHEGTRWWLCVALENIRDGKV